VAAQPLVGIVMGSKSDLGVMSEAAEFLESAGIACEVGVVSAHRTPDRAHSYASTARDRGLKVLIAGAGGAAHLAGVMASLTTLPVIGVPLRSSISLDGWDSVLSTLQMPPGIPVATVGLDAARNAGILAAEIIGAHDPSVAESLKRLRMEMTSSIEKTADEIRRQGYKSFLKPKG
jgi:5-(carboxyamino)imidazole ribonucleotide mutase